MIVKVFDNGWGSDYPLKKYEQSIVNDMLSSLQHNGSQVVLINSVWYTDEYHQQVLQYLRNTRVDIIVLVAMLDASIPNKSWYQDFDCEVIEVGYYPGLYELDFCALFVNEFLTAPPLHELLSYQAIDLPFMSLNRKPHWHRVQFFQQLRQHGLVEQGLVSMGSESGSAVCLPQDREHDDLAPNATRKHYGIPNDIVSLGDPGNWSRCFLNIVTETFYDINRTNFVSEKIYKPIVGCRPFLVYDPDGGSAWLTRKGFEPYVNDFSDISDLDLTCPENVVGFLHQLCQQPSSYWQKKFVDLLPKIMYNKDHFADHVRAQQLIIQKGITCQI